MKRILIIVCLFLVGFVKSQAPEKINYQGIARDAGGNIISTAIGLKFEIHSGSASGPVVYDETHTITPSAAGIFTAAIGGGVVGTGNFSTISWGTDSYFLTVNMDPAGGTSYSTVGTSQLLSVPYALYAKTSGNASTTYSAGTGISISGGIITNTLPGTPPTITGTGISSVITAGNNYTVNTPVPAFTGAGGTTVSGSYPSYTITSSTSTSASVPSTLSINPPHLITNIGPNNNSITIQPTNITGSAVSGSYPNYTITSSPSTSITSGSTNIIVSGTAPAYTIISLPPVITGTGVTTVTASANNFTVNTPPTKLTYTPSTGIISYSPAIGINTLNISPALTFTNNILTVGSSTTTILGTNIWTRPSSSVTTLTNANDNVGIGITTPNNRLHVVESANGIAAISAVNTYSIASGSAQGLFASSNNSHSVSAAVYGTHSSNGVGVSGINSNATSTTAAGVYGLVMASFSTAIGVEGYGTGLSTGIKGTSAGNGISILGTKPAGTGGGNAGKFEILSTTNTADALFATTNGGGAAIHAVNGPTVTGSSNVLMLLENGHIKTIQSAKPTIATSTGLGTGSSCSINGNGTDIAGEILMNTGTLATGPPYNLVQVTFNKPLSTGGSAVIILTPRSPQTAGLQLFATPIGNTGFVVGTNNTPGAFTNYQIFYYVIER